MIRKIWWVVLAVVLLFLLLVWWLPALVVGLLPHEVAFLVGLLGFFLLGQGYLWELGWTLTLLRRWRAAKLAAGEAQTRLADRLGVSGMVWLALWQAWQRAMQPRRTLFYGLVGFTGLLLLVFGLGLGPSSLLPVVWTGFFLGAATTAFLTWALEEAIADLAEDTLLAGP